jgi:signal transduction histidine kinase
VQKSPVNGKEMTVWRKHMSSFTKELKVNNLVTIYRYGSLFITSLFYIAENDSHELLKKIFIISCISITAIILNYLYIKNTGNNIYIKILLFIEIIGNSIILIPSGGLNSPYIWYAINTLFISAIFLGTGYLWANMGIYIFNILFFSSLLIDRKLNILSSTSQEANLILSFILVTGIVHVLSEYIRRMHDNSKLIEETNNKLRFANNEIKQSMNYIVELYKAVHHLSIQQEKRDLIELIVEYSKKIVNIDRAIFINTDTIEQEDSKEKLINFMMSSSSEAIYELIMNQWQRLILSAEPFPLEFHNKQFILCSIKNDYKVFGLLIMDLTTEANIVESMHLNEKLKFITDLSAIVLERAELEHVNERLLINEEQNRIANEIHDGVLQKLFSISCSLFGISSKLGEASIEPEKLVSELNLARNAMNGVMKELRSTIYGLSWKKYGDNNFIDIIKTYIDDIRALNDIDILFHFDGKVDLLSYTSKKSIYRIICEGIGNAIRHGEAKLIEVSLMVNKDKISLVIVDNGSGFNMEQLEDSKNVGLGVDNIHQLTYLLNGSIQFDSEIGKGTTININIPNERNGFSTEVIL